MKVNLSTIKFVFSSRCLLVQSGGANTGKDLQWGMVYSATVEEIQSPQQTTFSVVDRINNHIIVYLPIGSTAFLSVSHGTGKEHG